jgi:hypothetical protein
MLLVIDTTSARVLARYSAWAGDQEAITRALAATAANHGLDPGDLLAHLVDDPDQAQELDQAPLPDIQPSIADGQVTGVSVAPAPTTLYLHVDISGHSGTYQGVPLFAPGDPMSVQVALRTGTEPDSTLVPISGTWPIPVLAADGSEYDRVFVQTSEGQAGFTYPIPERTGRCSLSEQGLDRIEYGGATYQICLAQPVTFYVGRTLGTAG